MHHPSNVKHLALATAMVITLLAISFQTSAASNRPYNLVCFEKQGMIKSLNTVVNMQQLLRNDSTLRSGSCDYVQIPKGSTALNAGFHQSQEGFIFPLYQVTYSTTRQRMYAADGVFKAKDWKVAHGRRCGYGVQTDCLLPKSCEVMNGYMQLTGNRAPSFMRVPPNCQQHVIR